MYNICTQHIIVGSFLFFYYYSSRSDDDDYDDDAPDRKLRFGNIRGVVVCVIWLQTHTHKHAHKGTL